MDNTHNPILIDRNTDEGQFALLCDYGDIITSQSIIIQNEFRDEFFLYKVVEPFPLFEEYCEGNDFEEAELISIHKTWQQAKTNQLKLKPKSP